MKSQARAVDLRACPPSTAKFITPGQVFIKAGHKYDVFALAVFEGQTFLQIVNDLGYPSWVPSWLFETIDPSLPADWICNVFQGEPSVIVGPAFIAQDQLAYARMVQLETNAVALFWKRVESAAAREP